MLRRRVTVDEEVVRRRVTVEEFVGEDELTIPTGVLGPWGNCLACYRRAMRGAVGPCTECRLVLGAAREERDLADAEIRVEIAAGTRLSGGRAKARYAAQQLLRGLGGGRSGGTDD